MIFDESSRSGESLLPEVPLDLTTLSRRERIQLAGQFVANRMFDAMRLSDKVDAGVQSVRDNMASVNIGVSVYVVMQTAESQPSGNEGAAELPDELKEATPLLERSLWVATLRLIATEDEARTKFGLSKRQLKRAERFAQSRIKQYTATIYDGEDRL